MEESRCLYVEVEEGMLSGMRSGEGDDGVENHHIHFYHPSLSPPCR